MVSLQQGTSEPTEVLTQTHVALAALSVVTVVPAPGINLRQIPTLRSKEAQLHHREFAPEAGGSLVYFPFPKGKGVTRVTWTKGSVLDGMLQLCICLLVYRIFIFFGSPARMCNTL